MRQTGRNRRGAAGAARQARLARRDRCGGRGETRRRGGRGEAGGEHCERAKLSVIELNSDSEGSSDTGIQGIQPTLLPERNRGLLLPVDCIVLIPLLDVAEFRFGVLVDL